MSVFDSIDLFLFSLFLLQQNLNGRLLTVNKAAPRGSQPVQTRFVEPSFRIYVGNLPWQVDDARLEQVFSEHGKVTSARVVLDRETGRSRGFGFVTMSSEMEVNDAIAALDGQVRPYISMHYIVCQFGSDFLSSSMMFSLNGCKDCV